MVAIAFLVAALVFGVSEAHFKCNRNIQNSTHKNQILELGKLLSLESLCMDFCEQSNCSLLDGPGGLLGGVLGGSGGGPLGGIGSGLLRRRRCANGDCTSDSASTTAAATTQSSTTQGGNGGENGGSPCSSGNGPCSQGGSGSGGNVLGDLLGAASCLVPGGNPNKITPYQACVLPCILDLNVLDICDVQAIITKVVRICPKIDLKGVCVSACLCCGKENETVDACVNLCLSSQGIDLNLSPLKILGLGGEDAVNAPTIDGFELPGLPLLPQLGLGGSGSASASGSGSSSNASGSASASSSSNSGSSSGSNGETTTASSGTTAGTTAATTASA